EPIASSKYYETIHQKININNREMDVTLLFDASTTQYFYTSYPTDVDAAEQESDLSITLIEQIMLYDYLIQQNGILEAPYLQQIIIWNLVALQQVDISVNLTKETLPYSTETETLNQLICDIINDLFQQKEKAVVLDETFAESVYIETINQRR